MNPMRVLSSFSPYAIVGSRPDGERIGKRTRGITALEVMVVITLVTVLAVSTSAGVFGLLRAFNEEQIVSVLFLEAERAMDRITSVAAQGVSTDPDFGFFVPTGTSGFSVMRFRLISSLSGGVAVYDDELPIYIMGRKGAPYPCEGVIIGRGPDLATIHGLAAGPDGILGTRDDNLAASHARGVPAAELLVPAKFAPRAGAPLLFEPDPADPLLLRVTLRLNAKENGQHFILPNDIVLTRRIALKQ